VLVVSIPASDSFSYPLQSTRREEEEEVQSDKTRTSFFFSKAQTHDIRSDLRSSRFKIDDVEFLYDLGLKNHLRSEE